MQTVNWLKAATIATKKSTHFRGTWLQNAEKKSYALQENI